MGRDWQSPLKSGQVITTGDGFKVKVVKTPNKSDQAYNVAVLVLKASHKFRHLVGKIHIWAHLSPNRFLRSKIRTINGKSITQETSLEEEFFRRTPPPPLT